MKSPFERYAPVTPRGAGNIRDVMCIYIFVKQCKCVVYLTESAYGGTPVLSVKADDADLSNNKKFTYAIHNINNTAGTTYFQVNIKGNGLA